MIVKSRRETLGLLAAGAAAVPGLAGLAKAQAALRPMRLRLDFLATTPHVYFFAAREKGFFAEEGLNIEILEGNTSAQSIQQVANKGDDFGVAGFDALVHSTQEGLPATMIMCNFRNTPNVVLSLESSGISSPADLEGKTIGVRAGSGPTTMFPALMAKAGVNAEKVSQLNLDFSAFIPSLLAKRISGFVGFAPTQYPVLVNLAKEPVKVLYYTESGLVALSMGIVTHPDTIRDKPDQVRGFVRAAQRGMKWSRENPADAEKMLVELFPRKIKAEEARLALSLLPKFEKSSRTQDAPLGFIHETDATDTIQILQTYAGLKVRREPSSYYTNTFIDPSIR